MHALTLRLRMRPGPETRPLLRAIAAAPAPELPGLRARHWRAEQRGICGLYLFEDQRSLDAFDPAADPARAFFACGHDVEWRGRLPSLAFDRPVFLICAPRAGGTLLYELLVRAAGLVSIDGESEGVIEGIPCLHPASRGFESHRLTDLDAGAATVETLRAGFIARLRDRRGCPPRDGARIRLLEKTPENTLRIPFLTAAFPDARFIFLHRDARQNISSLAEAWHHDGFVNIPELPGWDRRRWCFLLPPEWRGQNGRSLSDVAAFQWRVANQQAMHDLQALPRDRWLGVDYAELVTLPAATLRKLCDFIDIDVDREFEEVLRRPLPLSNTTVTPPSPTKWRTNRHFERASLAGLGPIEGQLRNLMVAPSAPAAPPARAASVRFACFLDEGAAVHARPDGAIVHPSLQLQLGATVPLSLLRQTRRRERFLPDHPIAWIEDPATGLWSPFFARRAHIGALMQLRAGAPPPSSPEALRIEPYLLGAGIITTAAGVDARRRDGEARREAGRRELAEEALCTLPALLHPMQVAALARYYRELIEAGWSFGDDQVERRHGWHNEPLCSFLHHQLTAVVAAVAGEPVKPTYCYASAYRGSAALPAHLDRRQCEYTMSLLVEHASASAEPWPLWFLGPHGRVSRDLLPGDAALFRGCELPHWREAAPADQNQTTLLFHWVPSEFEGVLD